MNSARDIEKAIERLSSVEQEKLAAWFENRFQDRWDARLQEDASSGKLDALYRQLSSDGSELVAEEVSLDDFLDDTKLS